MAVSAFTPNLDKEILKLRRKLGDTFDASGNEMSLDTAPGAGKVYVGDLTYSASLTAQELLDTYNDAVRSFIDYVIRFIDSKDWHLWIPGYLQLKDSIDLAKTSTPVRYYYDLAGLTDFYWVMDVVDSNGTGDHQYGVPISPAEYFTHYSRFLKTRANQLLYTRMRYNITTQKDCLLFVNPVESGGKATIHLTYVRTHVDLVHNSGSDLAGVTGVGLRRIQTIAESMALRYRSQEVKDLPDVEVQTNLQMDSAKRSAR